MSNVLWSNLRERLSQDLKPNDFELWIKPLKPLSSSTGKLILSCPNHLHLRQVQKRFAARLNGLLAEMGSAAPVQLVSTKNNSKGNPAPAGQMPLPNMGAGTPLLNRRFLFDSFVSGGGNELAFAAAKAMAQGRRLFSDTLFLVSGTGLGKSHLTQAVGHQVLSGNPGARVSYLTAEEFTNQMVSALRHKRIEAFKNRFRRECDVLLLEEVQFLSGKEKTQEELSYTLDALFDAGKRVIFTSPMPASQVKGLKPSLESRMTAGITVSIDPPDHITRVRILERMCQEEGMVVEREVLEFLAQEITSDVRRLQSALVGFLAKGSLSGRSMDLGLAAEVLGQITQRLRSITCQQIRDLVARVYGMEVSVLTGKGRAKAVTRPRNLAMTLCRRHTESSYAAIGKVFNRDHATVMYGVNKVGRDLGLEPKLARELAYLEQRLGVNSQ